MHGIIFTVNVVHRILLNEPWWISCHKIHTINKIPRNKRRQNRTCSIYKEKNLTGPLTVYNASFVHKIACFVLMNNWTMNVHGDFLCETKLQWSDGNWGSWYVSLLFCTMFMINKYKLYIYRRLNENNLSCFFQHL